MHWEKGGAFTGEVSAAMLQALQVKHVVIGHSERRQLFGESDAIVAKKPLPLYKSACIQSFVSGKPWLNVKTIAWREVLERQLSKRYRRLLLSRSWQRGDSL